MQRRKHKSQRQWREYETIELCGRPAQLRRIKYAAKLKGISVSDFIVSSLDAAAVKTIQSTSSWTLGVRDTKILVNALMNPPKPNSHMLAAFRSHRVRVEST